jgi:hypothetical protein
MTAWCLWWRISTAGLHLREVAREGSGEAAIGWRLGLGERVELRPSPPLYRRLGGQLGPSSKPRAAAQGGGVWGKFSPLLLEDSLRVSPLGWPAGP